MGKTVIAIEGAAKAGKTHIVKKFREILIQNYPNHKEHFLIDENDIKTIITITLPNGIVIKVGIESQGDPDSRLVHERLEDFKDCDIVICACRTKGETAEIVYEFAHNNGFEAIWIKPAYSIEKYHNLLQQLSAEYILSIFQHIVK
jgi:hypothetical protein